MRERVFKKKKIEKIKSINKLKKETKIKYKEKQEEKRKENRTCVVNCCFYDNDELEYLYIYSFENISNKCCGASCFIGA